MLITAVIDINNWGMPRQTPYTNPKNGKLCETPTDKPPSCHHSPCARGPRFTTSRRGGVVCLSLSMSVSVYFCLRLPLSVSVCRCLSLPVAVCRCLSMSVPVWPCLPLSAAARPCLSLSCGGHATSEALASARLRSQARTSMRQNSASEQLPANCGDCKTR